MRIGPPQHHYCITRFRPQEGHSQQQQQLLQLCYNLLHNSYHYLRYHLHSRKRPYIEIADPFYWRYSNLFWCCWFAAAPILYPPRPVVFTHDHSLHPSKQRRYHYSCMQPSIKLSGPRTSRSLFWLYFLFYYLLLCVLHSSHLPAPSFACLLCLSVPPSNSDPILSAIIFLLATFYTATTHFNTPRLFEHWSRPVAVSVYFIVAVKMAGLFKRVYDWLLRLFW